MDAKDLDPEILAFAVTMQNELNANKKKGDWKDWKDVKNMINELDYHKNKMIFALTSMDIKGMKEYLADTANILMFIGNLYHLYNDADKIKLKESVFNTPIDKIDDTIINEVCLNFNHSFGLMTYPERRQLMFEAKEWLHAWQKIK